MITTVDQRFASSRGGDTSSGALRQGIDKAPSAVGAIAYKGTSGDFADSDLNASNIDAVRAKAVDIQMTEVVVTNTPKDGTGLPHPPDLIDKNGRCARRIRTRQRLRFIKPFARGSCHELHQNLADGEDLLSHNLSLLTLGTDVKPDGHYDH